MNLSLLLVLYPAIIVAPEIKGFGTRSEFSARKRNVLVNILINKLFAYIRHIIIHGSAIFGIPILDPFEMEDFHFIIPTSLFSLHFRFENISVNGFGGFILHRNILHVSNLTFEMEVSLPRVIVSAGAMHVSEIDYDFTSPVPIYNKGKTELEMVNFRLQANLQLKQSDDEKSILVDKIDNAYFDVPSFKINLNGATDEEHSTIFSDLEERLVDYVKSCKGPIINFMTNATITFGNPILNRFDTWRYIDVLI